jgi:hypothetical protein
MITSRRPKKDKIEIDLLGPDGNAFVLLSIAKDLSHKLNKDWDIIHSEMTSADYEWLIQVMDHHFGDFIIMYR